MFEAWPSRLRHLRGGSGWEVCFQLTLVRFDGLKFSHTDLLDGNLSLCILSVGLWSFKKSGVKDVQQATAFNARLCQCVGCQGWGGMPAKRVRSHRSGDESFDLISALRDLLRFCDGPILESWDRSSRALVNLESTLENLTEDRWWSDLDGWETMVMTDVGAAHWRVILYCIVLALFPRYAQASRMTMRQAWAEV